MLASESTPPAGLCATCNNSPTCFYRSRRGPALFCEMFDDLTQASGADRLRPASASNDAATIEDVSKYAGLCVNCENRRICNLPKSPGGVWHCENYE